MDVPKWYAISLGTIVVACLLYRVISGILAFIRKITTFFFLKHFTYPNLHRRILWIGTATRIQVLSVIAYISGNILCMTIGSTTMSQVTARAGILSIINMIPLLVGPRLAMVADLVGISIRTNLRIHEWIGRMAILQGMIHTILPFVGHRPFRWDSIRSSGVVGSIALGAILLGSFKITRSIAYEVFLRTHILVSVVIVVSLWYHLKQQNTSTRIYLWINLSVWALTTALHWAIFIFRNVVLGRPFARATVSYLSDAFQVDVVVPRPWHVKAGQYVYLTIPGAGTWSALEGHPFMISWWARDERGLTCSLLVQPRRGFSSRMFKRLGSPLRAFIDGPYGLNHEFGQYGTVIMFATGIGIAAQLPYVKELINGYNNCEVRTRSVQLHWVMEKDCHHEWIGKWMDEALAADSGYILEASLYVPSVNKADESWGKHGMMKKIYNAPDIGKILRDAFARRKGKLMVSVSSHNTMEDVVRGFVQRNLTNDVRLVELDFQPPERRNDVSAKGFDFGCQGILA